MPSVTVLVPALNEEADIERCLRAVLAQDHPHAAMEIVLVDGGSTDRTVSVAAGVLGASDVPWKIVDNPTGTTPSNLNAGLAVASGELLCRVDARSIIPPEYVRHCAEVLSTRPDVVVTGGAQVAIAVGSSPVSVGIARALNNKYAMGGARYRSGAASGPSDTVYLGAFRTGTLRRAGGWNEFFETNQDYELNRRLGRDGVVWFDDRLKIAYIPRRSLTALWRQYHRFGRWKVRYWRRTGDAPRPRQWAAIVAGTVGPVLAAELARRSRRDRRLVLMSTLAVAAGAALEARGARGPRGGGPARAVATVAMPLLGVGWVSGVVREFFAADSAYR